MNPLPLLKSRSHHNNNYLVNTALAGKQTATLSIRSTIKLDNSSSYPANYHNVKPQRNVIESISKRLNIYITVDTQWFTHFRQLIMRHFKDHISSIRIEPIEHARKMKVCLCFDGKIEDKLMSAIMQNLPSAEFGRITVAKLKHV